jgi:hypothetical protein
MKSIPINEASAAQLRYHAETVLGLEAINKAANRGQIIAKIEQAAPGTKTIQVDDVIESPAQVQAEETKAAQTVAAAETAAVVAEETKVSLAGMSAKQAAQHHHDPKIEVLIPSTPEKGGDRAVPVSVNGIQFTVKRDEWVSVPYRVFEVLEHARETTYEHTNNAIGQMEVKERETCSYAFSTRNGPDEATLADWRKRTESVELA